MTEQEKINLSQLITIYANLEVQRKMLGKTGHETAEWCAIAKKDIIDFVESLVTKAL